MSEPTAEQIFDLFEGQWRTQAPQFKLDDPHVRNSLMSLLSAAVSVLVASPESFDAFIAGCSNVAKTTVPRAAQERIKTTIETV